MIGQSRHLNIAALKVIISVDWEGIDLTEQNLEAIYRFKNKYKVPLLHYLNPSYLLKDAHTNAQKIRSVLFPEDELGLHLHPQRKLIEQAGLEFKSGPCFSRNWTPSWGDLEGQEVMLHSYSKSELDQLIQYSLNLLGSYGFTKINSFRAGGWMAQEDVFEAVRKNNIYFESSATSPTSLKGTSWQGDNLERYLQILWPDISNKSKPYDIQTPYGKLIEVPNNLGAIDYWDENLCDQKVEESISQAFQQISHLLVINSHQETSSQHWSKLESFIDKLKVECFNHAVKLDFTTHRDFFHFNFPTPSLSKDSQFMSTH